MIKRMIIMLLLCGLVFGGVFGFKMYGKKMMMQSMAAMGNPAQTVSSYKATLEEWRNELKAVGTLRAVKGTDVAPELAGTVENIFVESGQDVEEGTLLVQLRSQDDQAKLAALEANLRLAQLTFARDEKQIAVKAISQATYDADKAALENLKAQTDAQKATLEKKAVLAPFTGRLGLRQVDVGQYLAAGTPMFALQQLDPIFVDFSLPQQNLTQIQVGQKIEAKTDAFPDKVFEGTITAIDSRVEESTRNINVRATLQNPDKTLRPGMFANVSVSVGEPMSYLTVPQTAITFNPYGSTVYVIDGTGDALTARVAFVKTGPTRGDQIAVIDGLKDGDVIVTAGQMKLRNGSRVTINNAIQPLNDPNPQPKDE